MPQNGSYSPSFEVIPSPQSVGHSTCCWRFSCALPINCKFLEKPAQNWKKKSAKVALPPSILLSHRFRLSWTATNPIRLLHDWFDLNTRSIAIILGDPNNWWRFSRFLFERASFFHQIPYLGTGSIYTNLLHPKTSRQKPDFCYREVIFRAIYF